MRVHTKRDLFELAARLARSGTSYVVATVVHRAGLSSAHLGDMAIVAADGSFHGWVGGGCTRPTVEREAAIALETRTARLVLLSPEPVREPPPGVLVLPMTCHSGGTVELYLDPVIASPRLALFGRSPIIATLAALAHDIGYLVDVADPDARADEFPSADRVFESIDAPELAGAAFAVVGTMGDFDEEAANRALSLGASYVGVIASRKRFALLRDALVARGIATDALAAISNPAGLDLGAREPGEVAVSILAQIVARRNAIAAVSETTAVSETASAGETAARRPTPARRALPIAGATATGATATGATLAPPPAESAIDPVCKMTVKIAGAKHVAEWDGRTWYFCCGGCKTRFLAAPASFLSEPVKGATA